MKNFAKKSIKLKKVPAVLNIFHGYQIPFTKQLYQTSLSMGGKITPEEKELLEEEIN